AKIGEVIKNAIFIEMPQSSVEVVPMADGGEGTIEVLLHDSRGTKEKILVNNAKGEIIETYYGVLADSKTVIIEVALITGFNSIPTSNVSRVKYIWNRGMYYTCSRSGVQKIHILFRWKCDE